MKVAPAHPPNDMKETKGLGLGLRFMRDRVRDSAFSTKEANLRSELGVRVQSHCQSRGFYVDEDGPLNEQGLIPISEQESSQRQYYWSMREYQRRQAMAQAEARVRVRVEGSSEGHTRGSTSDLYGVVPYSH